MKAGCFTTSEMLLLPSEPVIMSVSSAPEGRARARAQVQGETKKNKWRDPDLFTQYLDGNVMIQKNPFCFLGG